MRQQTIYRTFVAELSESQEDDIGSGGGFDDTLGEMAEKLGILWIADEHDVWDEPTVIEVDAEDVGDLYDERYSIVVPASGKTQ